MFNRSHWEAPAIRLAEPVRRATVATVRRGAGEVRQAVANPQLELLERLGYAVRGALYAVMGFLAVRIALATPGGKATALAGSLVSLICHPFRKPLLIVT